MLPGLQFSFLRSSQMNRAEPSAGFASIQSSKPVPPTDNRVQTESRWIETLQPGAKLMRSTHDGCHTQGLYANAKVVSLPRPEKALDAIKPLALTEAPALCRSNQRGVVRVASEELGG